MRLRHVIFVLGLTCLVSPTAGLLASTPAEAQPRLQGDAPPPQAVRKALDAVASQLGERAQALFYAGAYQQTLAVLEQRATFAPENREMELIRAWSLYHLNRYDKALSLFSKLDDQESTRDTQYGIYYSRRELDPTHIGD